MPDRIGGVADDSGPSLLPMVGAGRKTALLPWLNGHLKIRVRIEEHPFLEPNCPEIFKERGGGGGEEEAGEKEGSRKGEAEKKGGRIQTSWLAQTAKFLTKVLIQSSRQRGASDTAAELVTLHAYRDVATLCACREWQVGRGYNSSTGLSKVVRITPALHHLVPLQLECFSPHVLVSSCHIFPGTVWLVSQNVKQPPHRNSFFFFF